MRVSTARREKTKIGTYTAEVEDGASTPRLPVLTAAPELELELESGRSGHDETDTVSSSSPLVLTVGFELAGEIFVSFSVCWPLGKPLV